MARTRMMVLIFERRSWATFILISLLAATVLSANSEAASQKRWSLDWESLWPEQFAGEHQSCRTGTAKVAATDSVVALAVGRSCELSSSKGTLSPIQRPYWMMVFFFDATSGRLLAKREPERSDSGFRVFATAEGNFVVCLRNYTEVKKGKTDSLILLSPLGTTLKSVEIAPTGENSISLRWQVLISPSRKTLLVTRIHKDTTFYQVLDADTLTERAAWQSAGQMEPKTLSVSDTQILGMTRLSKSDPSVPQMPKNPEVSSKAFDGTWHPLLLSSGENLLYSYSAFISDEQIIVMDSADRQAKESFLRARVCRTNGYQEASKILKKSSGSDISARWQIATSLDGRSFVLEMSSVSRFWQVLDVYPSRSEILVFRTKELEPVLTIKNNGRPSDFCLLPNGSQLVILDGKTLKVYSLS